MILGSSPGRSMGGWRIQTEGEPAERLVCRDGELVQRRGQSGGQQAESVRWLPGGEQGAPL